MLILLNADFDDSVDAGEFVDSDDFDGAYVLNC